MSESEQIKLLKGIVLLHYLRNMHSVIQRIVPGLQTQQFPALLVFVAVWQMKSIQLH